MYDNNVVIILNEKQTNLKIKLKNIDRVIVNKVRLYSNRSTVQGHKVTGNYCTHVIGCTR